MKALAPITAIGATLAMALWMANRDPVPRGPLWGAMLALLAAGAWTSWWVPAAEGPARSWRDTALGPRADERSPPWVWALLALLVLVTGSLLGGHGTLPLTIALALVCLVPPALHRPGLAVMLVVAGLYLPMLGVTGLWDPWETHYAEVAREILARNDWISLWWAQDKWFWSKPVLLFWMEAWSMAAFGVSFMPDAHPLHPEWAVRLPTIAMALLALGVVYGTVRRVFDARAGAMATLVTATLPQFFFVAHQAITDLPLVASITIALCCLVLALREDPERQATMWQIGRWRLSLQHVVVFALFALVLPQAIYLISRNFSWFGGAELVAHPDRFLYGSAHNVDVPGNPRPRQQLPAVRGLLGQPFLQGALWLGALAALASWLRRERRARPLWMVAFYIGCAIAFLAKGLPGLVIPGAAALFYLIASRRWSLLSSGELRISKGLLIVTSVSLPWYLAMYVRHGTAFTNRLLIHDHINRLASGVHGDKGTIQYFLAQIGYATFPWIALVPAALWMAFWIHARRPRDPRGQTILLLSMWMLSAFVLFSAMVTKYHHYILPALVPLAILVGIGVAQWWGRTQWRATMFCTAAALCLVAGFAWLAGDPRGIVPADAVDVEDWVLQQAEPLWALVLLAIGAALAAAAFVDLGQDAPSARSHTTSTSLGIALVAGACIVAFVGRDLSWATAARPQGYERLIHLFVYNYGRAWPDHLDYRAALTGFAVAVGLTTAMASLSRFRAVATRTFVAIAVLFGAWALDVYMVDLAPHWGSRDLVARYYQEREGEEPLLAWQMNWKGENFYTGNRVYVFAETDNKRIRKWLEGHQGQTVYVLLERKRLERFRKLVKDGSVRELTTPRDNNKFVLVALELGPKTRIGSAGFVGFGPTEHQKLD